MGLATNSYGSVAEVAALVPMWTEGAAFTASTRPSYSQVEQFLDRVSAIVNTLLAQEGFGIPVTNDDAKLALSQFVIEECADLCDAVNRSGRFFLSSEELAGRGRFRVILSDAKAFIAGYADGLQGLGATRTKSVTYGLGYCATDDGGDAIEPIFSRGWMDQSVRDWDSE
jgi:hypothetical protein